MEGSPMQNMYLHRAGCSQEDDPLLGEGWQWTIHAESTIPAARFDLDRWIKTLPQLWTAEMETTVLAG